MLKKRIRGIVCVVLGGLGLGNWIVQGMPLYSGSYGLGQKMGIAIFLFLFCHGLYSIKTASKDLKGRKPDTPVK